jgi:aryl-alcohol dehydrogenase-like predicted oxidoreductase
MLEGNYDENTTFAKNDHRRHRPKEWLIDGLKKVNRLSFLTESGERTLGQAALKFVLAQPAIACVVPTVTTQAELEEFAGTAAAPDLTEAELAEIEALYSRGFDVEPVGAA